jgi:hypothetical protein
LRWERRRAVYRVVQWLRERPGLETFVRRRLVGQR